MLKIHLSSGLMDTTNRFLDFVNEIHLEINFIMELEENVALRS